MISFSYQPTQGPFNVLTNNITVETNPELLDVHAEYHKDRQPEEVDILIQIVKDIEMPIYVLNLYRSVE